jgi:hypothetical protein
MDTTDPAAYRPVWDAFAQIDTAEAALDKARICEPPESLTPQEAAAWRDELVRAAQADLTEAETTIDRIKEESGLSPEDWRWNMTALLEGTDVALR